jgi:hypothetical protein
VRASNIRVIPTAERFSNFDFVDREFGSVPSIRRLFSQARSNGYRTLIVEEIPPVGILAEDNSELQDLFPDFRSGGLLRLSFWKKEINHPEEISAFDSQDLLGFAIIKQDISPRRSIGSWYVFESVFVKSPHAHNYVHAARGFSINIGDMEFSIFGVLYCQQNGLNKACAQVAIRALLSTMDPERELSYRQINSWAFDGGVYAEPWRGLDVQQIRRIFTGWGIGYFDIDYQSRTVEERKELPYQKFIYAGIESGCGALLGFRLHGQGLKGDVRHIIPFFGHTFNQDAWVPLAETAYFHVGENTKYLPSESWLSSFIGHDDNFGSNFCIPRLYIGDELVDYVVELFNNGCLSSGVSAEAIAVDYLYSILPQLSGNQNIWLLRLLDYVRRQQVVLRAVCVSSKEYFEHWSRLRDWNDNLEDPSLCRALCQALPPKIWLVEVSVPELYSANLHKLGEIILNAGIQTTSERDFSQFICGRLPGSVLLLSPDSTAGKPLFADFPSRLTSHTPLFGSS